MSKLEEVLEACGGVLESPSFASLARMLGEVGVYGKLAEKAVSMYTCPGEIEEFYADLIGELEARGHTSFKAIELANEIIGYGTGGFIPHRKIWMDTLSEIRHPILGRRVDNPKRKIITGVDLTLHHPVLLERFETEVTAIPDGMLFGKMNYQTVSDNPPKLRLTFDGHMTSSDAHILYLVGVLDSIKDKIRGESKTGASYSIKWNTRDLEDADLQNYWIERLALDRRGDSWLRRGLKFAPKESRAWIVESYLGQYPIPCIDGTPAPYGLNFTFNHDEPSKEVGIMSSFTIVGDQIADFLVASGVTCPRSMEGRAATIYEAGMQTVGIKALNR